ALYLLPNIRIRNWTGKVQRSTTRELSFSRGTAFIQRAAERNNRIMLLPVRDDLGKFARDRPTCGPRLLGVGDEFANPNRKLSGFQDGIRAVPVIPPIPIAALVQGRCHYDVAAIAFQVDPISKVLRHTPAVVPEEEM